MCFNIRAQNFWHNFFSSAQRQMWMNVQLVRTWIVTDNRRVLRSRIYLSQKYICMFAVVLDVVVVLNFLFSSCRAHHGRHNVDDYPVPSPLYALTPRDSKINERTLCPVCLCVRACVCVCVLALVLRDAHHRQRLIWKFMHNYVETFHYYCVCVSFSALFSVELGLEVFTPQRKSAHTLESR